MEPIALLIAVLCGSAMQILALAGAALIVLHLVGVPVPVVLILNANQLASLIIGSQIIFYYPPE